MLNQNSHLFHLEATENMNKEQVKYRSLLTCMICDLIYKNPVKLPCTKTICKSHLLNSNGFFLKEFSCTFCTCNHQVPVRGFHPNFFVQKQLEQNIHLSQNEINLKINLENLIERLEKVYIKIDDAAKIINEHLNTIRTEFIQQNFSKSNAILEITKNFEQNLIEKLNRIKSFQKLNINNVKFEMDLRFRRVKINIVKLKQLSFDMDKEVKFLEEKLENLIQVELRSFSVSKSLREFEQTKGNNKNIIF